MYKKTVSYTNFEGKEVREDVYFHLNKGDLVKWQMENGGLANHLEKIFALTDSGDILKEFKVILTRAYGKRSKDGKRFVKNDKVSQEFAESDAMGEVILALMTDPMEAAAMINGILPENLDRDLDLLLPTP